MQTEADLEVCTAERNCFAQAQETFKDALGVMKSLSDRTEAAGQEGGTRNPSFVDPTANLEAKHKAALERLFGSVPDPSVLVPITSTSCDDSIDVSFLDDDSPPVPFRLEGTSSSCVPEDWDFESGVILHNLGSCFYYQALVANDPDRAVRWFKTSRQILELANRIFVTEYHERFLLASLAALQAYVKVLTKSGMVREAAIEGERLKELKSYIQAIADMDIGFSRDRFGAAAA